MIRRALPLLFTSLLVLASCKDDVTPGPASAAPTPIVFGVSLDTGGNTGTTASAARPAIHALEVQVNSFGGIGGRPVVFDVKDDKGDDGDLLVANFQAFLDEGAVGVVGPINSGQLTALANAQGSFTAKLPIISPSATAASLSSLNTPGDLWYFRTAPSDNLQVKAMVKFATTRAAGACTKLAVAYLDDGAYGPGIESELEKRLPAGMFAGKVSLPQIAKDDYFDEVRQLADLAPTCLVLVAYDDVGGPFAVSLKAQLDQFPSGFFVIGSDGLRTRGLLEKSDPEGVGNPAADGFYGTAPDPNPKRSELTQFRQLFSQYKEYRVPFDPFTASAYDAAALLVLARAVAGVDDPVAVRDALLDVSSDGRPKGPADLGEILVDPTAIGIDYSGASGDVNFLAGGDVLSGYEVWHVVGTDFAVETQYRAEDLQ